MLYFLVMARTLYIIFSATHYYNVNLIVNLVVRFILNIINVISSTNLFAYVIEYLVAMSIVSSVSNTRV